METRSNEVVLLEFERLPGTLMKFYLAIKLIAFGVCLNWAEPGFLKKTCNCPAQRSSFQRKGAKNAKFKIFWTSLRPLQLCAFALEASFSLQKHLPCVRAEDALKKQNFRRLPIEPKWHNVVRTDNRNAQFLHERLGRARAWDAD